MAHVNFPIWKCPDCGQQASKSITNCRKCGRVQPKYEIKAEPATKSPASPSKPKPKKINIPEPEGDRLFVSTLKRKGK